MGKTIEEGNPPGRFSLSKNETLLSVKCFATIPCWSRFRKLAKCPFALLARIIFMQRRRMKDLLPRVCVVNRTSNLNSLRSLADYVKKIASEGGAASAATLFFLIQPIILLICDVVVIVAVVVSLTPSYLQFTAPFWQLPHVSQGFRWWHTGLPVIFFIFTRLLLWQRKYCSS